MLDTSQGYEFGSVLQQALVKWRKGATDALGAFLTEIGGLEPKDFAYLFRFRLLSEGERMGDYLEWMFGEGLKTLIDETIDWQDDAFKRLDDPKLSDTIEGAFDGPSLRVAQIFDRIRVNRHKTRPAPRYQIGDVYVAADKAQARVVITPDCDLVPRKGKTNASSVLTMSGRLRSFDQESTSADQFLLLDRKPRSVKWNTKDLRSIAFEGAGSLKDQNAYSYYGTLRPIYAQEVQRQAITDLSRVGLAVSPSMGVDASIRVHLRLQDGGGFKYSDLKIEKSLIATILLARGDGKDGHKVLFRRPFIHALLDALRATDPETLQKDDRDALDRFLKDQSESVLVKALLTGGTTPSKAKNGPLGIRLAIGKDPDLGSNNSWLNVMLELSEESMQELLTVDPTLQPEIDPEAGQAPPTKAAPKEE